MIMECVWWELAPGEPDIGQLQAQLEQVDLAAWQRIGALQAKYWIMNEAPPRWGAAMVWRDEKPDLAALPLNAAAEAIGRPPDVRLRFTVAASCLNESIIAPWASLLSREETCTTMSS
ncbi:MULTISPECIES: hypothetical protein [unclassified Serratia (in: enterobacteria)]|uniref:hypothetical protein n=1 Tax=unclassified Serratia (in: enterobacteria) TaxID=2647522 RepID=UPI0027FF0241|nr:MULTISPECIES: hypothetical protein [unclassified Serratia (in: enterobacteria)]MDQ7097748.1 hypothetical protein [Serratia sp. MF2]MDQ7105261.1 hypothetical protein [Serratia sp. MF1(2023)]